LVLVPESKPAPRFTEAERPSRKLADRPDPTPSLGGFILGSSIVIALLLGAFLLFKRFARNSRLLGAGGPIRVLARKGLGARHDLFLVEVGPRVFLLGATRDRLGTLGEFKNPDDLAALRADLPGRAEGTFRESFRESLDNGIRAEEKPAPDGVYASISEELAEIGRTVRAWKA
jgi:flagellar biogenesis protein FliO